MPLSYVPFIYVFLFVIYYILVSIANSIRRDKQFLCRIRNSSAFRYGSLRSSNNLSASLLHSCTNSHWLPFDILPCWEYDKCEHKNCAEMSLKIKWIFYHHVQQNTRREFYVRQHLQETQQHLHEIYTAACSAAISPQHAFVFRSVILYLPAALCRSAYRLWAGNQS